MISFDTFRFHMLSHPWLLALLVPAVLLFVFELFKRPAGVFTVSTGETMALIRRHKGALLRKSPALIRLFGLILLIIALARPLQGLQVRKDLADVRDIMLCVDISGSMEAEDFITGRGKKLSRLEVTKDAVGDFINSRKIEEEDRFGLDRLGLILYAGYAWTQCPLTLDYGLLEHEMEVAEIDYVNQKKNGTAIGSALGLAVHRLRDSESDTKVIILLTDGENNRGELDPITAAKFAAEYNIRIYTIGAGSKDEVSMSKQTVFGMRNRVVYAPIDEESLTEIAKIGNGKFYRATDTESLREAYAEINRLEATEIEIGDYYEYKEGFLAYAILGGLLVLSSIAIRRRWFETIP